MSRAIGVVSRDVLLAEDGVSFLRGLLAGRHPGPPFADAMDLDLAEVVVIVTGGHIERKFVELFEKNRQEFIQA